MLRIIFDYVTTLIANVFYFQVQYLLVTQLITALLVNSNLILLGSANRALSTDYCFHLHAHILTLISIKNFFFNIISPCLACN